MLKYEDLSIKQKNAIDKIVFWFCLSKFEPDSKDLVYCINGIAGSGKTSILPFIIKKLKLADFEIRYVAFSGNASVVLNKKGLQATTIHQLIYNSEKRINEDGEVYFINRLKSELPSVIKLIVLDEVSMAPDKLINDLKSFGIPILSLGDPCQCSAIGGDKLSKEILEKAEIKFGPEDCFRNEGGIHELAIKIRNKEKIEYGKYGNNAVVIPKSKLTKNMILGASQIICATNNQKDYYNNLYREISGISDYHLVKGEKIICLNNNWDLTKIFNISNKDIVLPLVNGTIGYLDKFDTLNENENILKINFRPEYSNENLFNDVLVNGYNFNKVIPQSRKMIDRLSNSGINPLNILNNFDYSYAITIHKSQGSQWKNVLVIFEGANRFSIEEQYRLLYTAVTRAEKGLILVI